MAADATIYSLDVEYVPGKRLVVPDTLSRATERSAFQSDRDLVRDVQLYFDTIVKTVPFSDNRLDQIKQETQKDSHMKELFKRVAEGWPNSRENCSPLIAEYWNVRADLSVAEGVIFKGTKSLSQGLTNQGF